MDGGDAAVIVQGATAVPMLSLVVLSFRNFETTTGPCLASLADAIGDVQIQLILVDNGSDDDAAAHCVAFAARHPSVVYLPVLHNLGFAGGMNAGVAATLGNWLGLVNSDTLFPSGAIPALLVAIQSAPSDVASIGPVTNAAGNGQRLPLPGLPMQQVVAIGAKAMRSPTGLLTPTYRSDFFCVAVRRAVWQQLGGLDPVFGLGYYEDFDFSLRLAARGYRQVIAEDVFVAHVGSASFSEMGATQKSLMKRNRQLLLERHPGVVFEHVRAGNAQALRYLLARARESGWTDGMRQRAAWRSAALLRDEPKSLFKRWRWRWITRGVRYMLAAAGVEPRFPVAPTLPE